MKWRDVWPPLATVGANRMRVLVILLLLLGTGCQGLQYQHDELLWTKQRWKDYKLSFPWAAFVKDRDSESVRQQEGPLHGFSAHSMNGPLLDAAEIQQHIEEDSRRRVGGRGMLRGSGWAGATAAAAAARVRLPPPQQASLAVLQGARAAAEQLRADPAG